MLGLLYFACLPLVFVNKELDLVWFFWDFFKIASEKTWKEKRNKSPKKTSSLRPDAMSELWQGRCNSSHCWEIPSDPTCHIFFPGKDAWLLLGGLRYLQQWRYSIGLSLYLPVDIWSSCETVKILQDWSFFSWNDFFFFNWSYIRVVPLAYPSFPQFFANGKCMSCTKSRYVFQTLIQLIWYSHIHLELIHTVSFPYLFCEGWS